MNLSKMQFCILVMFIFLASPTVFAQESHFVDPSVKVVINQNGNDDATVSSVKVSNSEMNSSMNFILWFMGTKEDVNSTISIDLSNSRKSVLTSGREPNHLLLKTLLKKAINTESC